MTLRDCSLHACARVWLVCALSVAFTLAAPCVVMGDNPLRPTKFPVIKKLKRLYPTTVIVENGRPRAIILTPDDAAYAAIAGRLQSAVKAAAGATLPIRRASEIVDTKWRADFKAIGSNSLIALGNVNNNRLLRRLYGEGYVAADSIYPGKGGHVVRTVHDPFARGLNVLALAGSDRAGVERAAAVFLRKYAKAARGGMTLPEPIIDVVFEKKPCVAYGGAGLPYSIQTPAQRRSMAWFRGVWTRRKFMDKQGRVIAHPGKKAVPVSVMKPLAMMEATWFRTGDRRLLPLMRDIIRKNYAALKRVDHIRDMSPRTATRLVTWDRLEELPIWSERDRLVVSNALLRDAMIGHERISTHYNALRGCVQVMANNHATFSVLNSYLAWSYFMKYYNLPEGRYWMRLAKACFDAQASTYQVIEDSASYLNWNPINAMTYAFRSRDLLYLERGIAQDQARYVALTCVNNLGLLTGFGDTPMPHHAAPFRTMAMAAWFHRDAKLYWVLRNVFDPVFARNNFLGRCAADFDVTPERPTNGPDGGPSGKWTGVLQMPLFEKPIKRGEGRKKAVFAPRRSIGADRFIKIVFKENWRKDGQYLLLDGDNAAGHGQQDLNTIINFCALGRMWMIDHCYGERAFLRHSGVFHTCNGEGDYDPKLPVRLLGLAENARYGATWTRFGDWERVIAWKKGRWFLVLDKIAAKRDGEYFARCTFKTLGGAALRGKDLLLEQAGRYCRIVSDGQASVETEPFNQPRAREWAAVYPFAKPVATYFTQDKLRKLKAGESLGFANLFYAYASPGEAEDVTLSPVGEHSALVRDRGRDALVRLRPDGVDVIADDGVISLGRGSADRAALGKSAERRRLIAQAQRLAREWRKGGAARVGAQIEGLAIETTGLDMPANVLRLVDLNGDGRREWVVGGGKGVRAYTAEGKRIWAFNTKKQVRCMDVGDVNGDPANAGPEIVAGCDDFHVYLLNSRGALLWTFGPCKRSGSHGASPPPHVDEVRIADLDRDPAHAGPEILVGANLFHVLDAAGKLKWQRHFIRSRVTSHIPYGDFVCGAVGDLDGDGSLESLAGFAYTYPGFYVYDTSGRQVFPPTKRRGRYRLMGYGRRAMSVRLAVVDLFGGRKDKQIVWASDRRLECVWRDQRWQEPNAGFRAAGALVDMAVFQPDPERPALVFTATKMNSVRAYGGWSVKGREIAGKRLWRRALDGGKITAMLPARLTAARSDTLFVGSKAGDIYALDIRSGRIMGRALRQARGLSAPINGASIVGFVADGDSVLAVAADGKVHRIRIRR